jgi:spore germination protein KB
LNRYFLYLILLNMMMDVVIFVPRILLHNRYDGSVSGMLLAIPLGIILIIVFSKALAKFPGKGLPEILSHPKHRWIRVLLVGGIQFAWFSAGLITLLGFLDILTRFINPEMPRLLLLVIYLAAIFLIITMQTQRMMYLLEIVLFLNAPLLFFIIFKALTSNTLNWDSMLEVGTHLFKMPNIVSLSTASYVFSGYMNLVVFNRVIKEKLKIWNFMAVFVMGVFNLFTTFFIPIGFHGSDGAQEYLYPWISTADSLRLVYSPIERVIFIFLMFYMSLTLMSISIHWHVSYELIRNLFSEKASQKKDWMILAAFAMCAVAGVLFFNTVLLSRVTNIWMVIRFGFEIMFVSIFFLWARRQKA